MVKLGDVCKIIGGYAFKSEEFITDGVPVIRISNLDGETVNVDKNVCYSVEFLKNNDNFIVRKNDILMAMSGATVGKIGVYPNEYVALLNQRVCNLKPVEDKLNREYLNCYCQSDYFKSEILKNAFGCAQPNISVKQIADFEIKILDLKSQVRIANKLKNILCLIEKRKQQLQKLDELVKARFVEMFGGVANSTRYPYRTVREFTDVISGGTPSRDINEYWDLGTIPWVKTTELKNNILTRTEEFITEQGLNSSSAKIVPAGTVLIAMYGQGKTRGMTGYLGVEACTNQACACILPSDKINSIYLWKFFVLSYDNLRDMAKGGNQPNLNGNIIKDFPVLWAPLDLQNQFADFVQQIDKSKLSVQKSLEKLEILKKALMQKYFG